MRADEGERLREVARAAKGHWDYDAEQVRSWAAGLDYGGKDVWAAEEGGHVAAYGTLVVEGERAKLDELWVEPEWIGHGVGSARGDSSGRPIRTPSASTSGWAAAISATASRVNGGGYSRSWG